VTNWIRKCELSVAGLTIVGGTVEQTLRVRFNVQQRTTQSPGVGNIFVTNPADATSKKILSAGEFAPVTLKAGYENGLYGLIFKGTLRQARKGKDNPTDTYINVLAADEIGYNFATVNKSLPPGSTGQDLFNALTKELSAYGVTVGAVTQKAQKALQQLKYPRGLALFGPVKELMRTLSHSINSTWSIQNGQLHMCALGDNIGGPWEINVNTGMIGMPVQTLQGIIVRSLINPNIGVNSLIHLNNADIQAATYNLSTQGETQNPRGSGTNSFNNPVLPSLDADGLYRVLMIEWTGDTRELPWYMDMWCVSQSGAPTPGELGPLNNAALNNTPYEMGD
jgi:hypothetical protein